MTVRLRGKREGERERGREDISERNNGIRKAGSEGEGGREGGRRHIHTCTSCICSSRGDSRAKSPTITSRELSQKGRKEGREGGRPRG